jgi:hypothetical protein
MACCFNADATACVVALRTFNATVDCIVKFDSDEFSVADDFVMPHAAALILKDLVVALRPKLGPGLTARHESDDAVFKVVRASSNEFHVKFKTLKPLPFGCFFDADVPEEVRAARAFFTKRAVEAARPAADPPRATSPPVAAAAPPADCDDPCVPDYTNMEELN